MAAGAAAANPPFVQTARFPVSTTSALPGKTEQDRSHSRSRTDPNAQLNSNSLHSPRRSSDAASRPPGSRDKDLESSPTREPNPLPTSSSVASTDLLERSKSLNDKSARIKSPPKPTFHARPETRNPPPAGETPGPQQQTPSLPSTSTLLKPPTTPSHEPKVGRLKRSPASHSSYGVETSNGPPPSISTQRTLSEDRLWRPAGTDYPVVLPPNVIVSPSVSPTQETSANVRENLDSEQSVKENGQHEHSTSEVSENPENPEDEEEYTLRVMDASTEEDGKGSSSGSREDLFLNIAKAEEERTVMTRAERRKSWGLHGSIPSPRSAQDPSRPRTGYSSARFSSAASHVLDEPNRSRYSGGLQKPSVISLPRSTVGRDAREESPESPAGYKRRGSNAESAGRAYKPSNLATYRSGRMVSASVADGYSGRQTEPDKQRVDGTESTISTTAPSTVWDELDDLKSRIRKLELTGKLPPSSAAAMATPTNDRPQTATTTITTMSSSPKHGRKKDSPVETSLNGTPSHVHPLLHEALANARSTVENDVYQKLEAAASDALHLATLMTGAQTSGQSVVGGGSTSERQARRRVDSLCRGLTELSIALAAGSPRPPTTTGRPSSRDTSSFQLPESSTRYRRGSLGPDDRGQSTPRVQSRLEPRRSSLVVGSRLESPRFSPETAINEEQSEQTQNLTARLNRNSLPLRNRRAHGLIDGANDEYEEESPQPRPISRAMTEAPMSSFRQSPRDRNSFAREYTSQHPLPSRETNRDNDSSPQTPSGSAIPRRSYVSSNLGSSPLTQTPPSNTGLRRYGTTNSAISTLSTRTVRPSTTNNTPTTTPSALPDIPHDSPSPGLGMDESMQRRASLRERLGAASSRIGSSVGSRLRAARGEGVTGTGNGRFDLEDRRRSRNFDLEGRDSRRASEVGPLGE